MKLLEGQIWKQGDEYIRIVKLERLAVEYKTMKELTTKKGPHLHATKKEFCRLLKNAVLLPPTEIKDRPEPAPEPGLAATKGPPAQKQV